MRTRKNKILIAGLLIAVGAVAVLFLTRPTATRLAAPTAIPVRVISVERKDVPRYVSGIGSVLSLHSVIIRPQIDGILTKLWVKEGQLVKSGDLLASLDDLSIRCPLSKGLHQERLKDRFALNLFLTTVLAGLAFGRIQRRRSGSRAARNGATAAVLLAVLDLVLLPYSYGKSMRSTYISEVVSLGSVWPHSTGIQ